MASILAFELEDPATEQLHTRRFEAVGVEAGAFEDAVGGEPFMDWIEEVEHELGTIDQSALGGPDGLEWTIGSGEIADRDAFVDRVVAKLRDMFGWTMAERT